MDRETQGREMQRLGAAPDYIVGSVHAITDDGIMLVASGTGSQLGAYAYAAGKVILVVGHQKLVTDLREARRRVVEYALPREFVRMQSLGDPAAGSARPSRWRRTRWAHHRHSRAGTPRILGRAEPGAHATLAGGPLAPICLRARPIAVAMGSSIIFVERAPAE